MSTAHCSVDGCGRPHYARGWCERHYWRQLHTGKLDIASKPGPKRRRPDQKACAIDGCDRTVAKKGWCSMHYARWRRTGRLDITPRPKVCVIEGCDRPVSGRGWCRLHYERWKRTGDPQGVTRIVGETERRFWSKVDKHGPTPERLPGLGRCWVWTSKSVANGGYGAFSVDGRMVKAHRFAYQLATGPIPEGLQLDHLCRNRRCVNPEHLEAVTQAENIARGNSGKHYGGRTECKWSHEFTPENTIVRPAGGRSCRECLNRRKREYRVRRKAQSDGSV